MKTLTRPSSMLSISYNNAKNNEIAYQYIQSDIDKMNSIVKNIETTANKLISLIPPNLTNEISSLTNQSQNVSQLYSTFNYEKYKNKLKLVKDSLKKLNQTVLLHCNEDNDFVPTKSFADTFYNDVTTRILSTTKQQCTNLKFCVESEFLALSKNSEKNSNFLTEIPRFETPKPKLVFCRKKVVSSQNENIVLAIKDQTERLSQIYSGITELRSLRQNKAVIDNNRLNLSSLSGMQEEDTRLIKELELQYNLLHMKNCKAAVKEAENQNDEVKEDFVTKDQLDSFGNLANSIIESAQKKFEEKKNKVKEEIKMIRTRLELLENKLNEFGDFTGETNDMMSYLGMKVDEVINGEDQLNNSGRSADDDQKSEELTDIYLDVRTRILKSSIESQLDTLKRSIHYCKFNQPLVSD